MIARHPELSENLRGIDRMDQPALLILVLCGGREAGGSPSCEAYQPLPNSQKPYRPWVAMLNHSIGSAASEKSTARAVACWAPVAGDRPMMGGMTATAPCENAARRDISDGVDVPVDHGGCPPGKPPMAPCSSLVHGSWLDMWVVLAFASEASKSLPAKASEAGPRKRGVVCQRSQPGKLDVVVACIRTVRARGTPESDYDEDPSVPLGSQLPQQWTRQAAPVTRWLPLANIAKFTVGRCPFERQ
ncbi:hypothetical protein G7046_g5154 [Stylonectria norvegica]|nr:hypothetical protein G7046_g5154 [Stylonectria norvegica]